MHQIRSEANRVQNQGHYQIRKCRVESGLVHFEAHDFRQKGGHLGKHCVNAPVLSFSSFKISGFKIKRSTQLEILLLYITLTWVSDDNGPDCFGTKYMTPWYTLFIVILWRFEKNELSFFKVVVELTSFIIFFINHLVLLYIFMQFFIK